MINDLKLGFGSLRYTYNLKGNIASAAIMFGLGTLISLFSSINMYMGGFLIMIAGMMPTQMIYSLDIAGLVLSSPVRKRMQTSIPTICSLVFTLGIYLFFSVIKGLCVWMHPEMLPYHCRDMVATAIFGAIMLLYMGAVFKYFWGPTIMFFIVYVIIRNIIEGIHFSNVGAWGAASFVMAILLGIVILVVGAFLSYLLSLSFYRKPVSKLSQAAQLRKSM